MTEAATILDLTNHRKWRKCLTVAGLLPTVSEGDRRRKLLTDDDLATLRRTRDALWPAIAPTSRSDGQQTALRDENVSQGLAARIAILERRVAILEAQLVRRAIPAPMPADDDAPPSDVPAGAMQAGPFAQQIGVPETTLRRWVERGEVESVSRPSNKPGQTERWLTVAGQQQARDRAARRGGA